MPPSALDIPDFRGDVSNAPRELSPYESAAGPYRFVPSAVVVPSSPDDVSALVRWAAREERALVPRGAGTGMPGHNVGSGVIVDLGRELATVGKVDRERRTIRVGPGARAAAVDAAARAAGLYFPPLPSSAERCTVGGMIANNAAGARSFRWGATRAWVEEVDAVLPDGSTAELGPGRRLPAPMETLRRRLREDLGADPARHPKWPAVRKNSSGYALDAFVATGDGAQLVTGSEGTLALVTSAVLRLVERPAERAVVLLRVPDANDLPDMVDAAGSAGAVACEYLGRRIIEMAELARDPEIAPIARDAEGLLLVELEGDRDAVESGLGALRELLPDLPSRIACDASRRESLWTLRHRASPTIEDAASRGLRSMQFIEDCVVPPGRLPAFLRGLRGILDAADTDAVVFGHAGDGNLHVNPLVDVARPDWRTRVRSILEATVDLVAGLGGTLSGEHGDGRVRAPFLQAIWGADLTRAFETTKSSLDPGAILNPGVILPVEGQDPLDGLRPPAPPHDDAEPGAMESCRDEQSSHDGAST